MNEQLDLFSFNTPKFKIDKPIRLIELFAGIGSQAAALRNLGADFTHYKVVEWDKYAMASYNAVHGTNFETSDIQKIHADDLGITETDKYCYIMTYSFPCQDLSLAGNLKGMQKGSGTRSGLLWEVERLLDECKELPQVLLMENVPQVIGKKNIKDFQSWRSKLESLGYSNFVQLLNAKDYGIPQNRNRCFMVSILGNYHYTFPKKQKLKLKLKDMLEDKVDEKYYLSDETVKNFVINNEKNDLAEKGLRFDNRDSNQVGYIEKGTGQHQRYSLFCRRMFKNGSGNGLERPSISISRNSGGKRFSRQTPMGSCEGFIGDKEHQSNKVYGTEMARTIDATEYKHPMMIHENEEGKNKRNL